jgi:Domain of unknown function (DUF1877)
MGCLGVHFAITPQEVAALKSIADERQRLDHLKETIEESYFDECPEFVAESDKAWDAMHRALADGKLSWDGGSYPLNHAVLAGELLYTNTDYIMSLKDPKQVRDIAAALGSIDEQEFRRRYFEIDATDYGFDLTEEDFGYTWEWFQNVRDLYKKAAAEGRYVLFSADQ